MQVEIWSDIVCPWCYLGKVRFERALDKFEHGDQVQVRYRAFQLDPTIPPGETVDVVKDLAAKKRVSEDEILQMMTSLEQTAATEGLEFHLAKARAGNTIDAHRLMHLAQDKALGAVAIERLYRAHFTELRSVFDHGSLIELGREIGLDRAEVAEMLLGGRYRQEVEADLALARQLGITGVPFFVIDRTFAISGAQSDDVLAQALQRAWEERPQLADLTADGQVCEDGICY